MRIELPRAAVRTKRFERPFIIGFIMTENVCVAVIGSDPEVHGLRPIPLILNRLDEERGIAEPELNGPFIGFVSGITFNAKFHGRLMNNQASYFLRLPIAVESSLIQSLHSCTIAVP